MWLDSGSEGRDAKHKKVSKRFKDAWAAKFPHGFGDAAAIADDAEEDGSRNSNI